MRFLKTFQKNANSTHFVVLKNDHPLHQNFKNISGISVWDPIGKLINAEQLAGRLPIGPGWAGA